MGGTKLGCAAGGAHASGGLSWGNSQEHPVSTILEACPLPSLTQPDLVLPLPLPISRPIPCPPCCLWTLSRAVDFSHNKDIMGLEAYSSWSSVDCSGQQLPELWASGPVVQMGQLR